MPFRWCVVLLVLLLLLCPSESVGQEKPKDEKAKPNIPITGKADAKYSAFDELLVSFLDKHKLPGAALAIAHNGQLVYSRGFGLADVENRQAVTPESLFRVCSVSKPITAVAVLHLIEKGKLKLDDKALAVLKLPLPVKDFDERWKKVTIRQLLEHRVGIDHAKTSDPMFYSPAIVTELKAKQHPATAKMAVTFMIKRKLDFDPGEKFAYSNFNYCMLGRVIEKASGQSYEGYVKQVLKPLNLTSLRQGRTLLSGRHPKEVKYYSTNQHQLIMGPNIGKQGPAPYGTFCLEMMDAHSGWVGTAEDLVRFACAFEEPSKCKVLSADSVESMFARPAGNKDAIYYAKGWVVRPFPEEKRSYWHDGSLDGSSAMLVRRMDGITFAILFNSREKIDKAEPVEALETPLHLTCNKVFGAK